MADQPIKSVIKALNVLKRFAFEKPYWGPRELAKAIHTSHSSAQRLLSTLAKEGVLTFSDSKSKYTIGPALWHLGIEISRQFDFQKIVRNIIEEYAMSLNETFYLYSYKNEQLIFEFKVESTHNLRYHLDIGVPYDIHIGAAGKCIIANLPPQEADVLIRSMQNTFEIDSVAFQRKIQEAKENGYSFTHGERVAGVVGFAAPIFSADGNSHGGVLLTIPDVRFNSKDQKQFGKIVQECADRISVFFSDQSEMQTYTHLN